MPHNRSSSALWWKIPASLLVLGLFLIPSSSISRIDGISLDPYTVAAVVLMLWLLWVTNWTRQVRRASVVLVTMALLLIVQLVVTAKLPYGWSTCFKPDTGKQPLTTDCQPTVQFPDGTRSYTVPTLSFASQHIPLFFFNTANFGYSQSQENRYSLPYTFKAQGYVWAKDHDSLTIATSIPYTQVSVNGVATSLQVGKITTIALPANKESEVDVQYAVPGSQVENTLSITTNARVYYEPVTQTKDFWAPLYTVTRDLGFIVLAFFFLGEGWVLLRSYSKRIRTAIFAATAILLALLFVQPGALYALPLFTAAVLALAWYVWTAPAEDRAVVRSWGLLALFFLTFAFINHAQSYGQMIIWPGDADTFTHTSDGYAIATATNWHQFWAGGEEQLYYYQPLYRYFVALAAKATGESVWGLFVLQTYVGALLVFFAIPVFKRLVGTMGALCFTLLIFIFTGLISDSSLFIFTQNVYQQSLGMPVFGLSILGTMWLFAQEKTVRWGWWLGLGLLMGLALMIRTDMLPAIPFLFILVGIALYRLYPTWKERVLHALAFLLPFMVAPAIVLLRNHIIADEWVLLPTSTLVNLLDQFKPLFNYTGRVPANQGGIHALLKIVWHYRSNPGTLIQILWNNIWYNIVLQVVPQFRQFIWYGLVAVLLFGYRYLRPVNRSLVIWLTLALLALLGVTSFFWLHLDYGMLAVFDTLAFFIIVLVAGDWLRFYAKPLETWTKRQVAHFRSLL